MVLGALRLIDSNLDVQILRPSFPDLTDKQIKNGIVGAGMFAAFMESKSREVAAYTFANPEKPFILFSSQFFDLVSSEELTVTVLHEILHILNPEDPDRNPISKQEAIQDIMCYVMLGVGIPANHWALAKYPELRPK
jgi:hypothetical protein